MCPELVIISSINHVNVYIYIILKILVFIQTVIFIPFILGHSSKLK